MDPETQGDGIDSLSGTQCLNSRDRAHLFDIMNEWQDVPKSGPCSQPCRSLPSAVTLIMSPVVKTATLNAKNHHSQLRTTPLVLIGKVSDCALRSRNEEASLLPRELKRLYSLAGPSSTRAKLSACPWQYLSQQAALSVLSVRSRPDPPSKS